MTPCVIGSRPHQAHDGLLLCRHHLDELGQALRDVETYADPGRGTYALSAAPSLAMSYDSSGHGLASQQSPIRIDAAAHTDPRTGRAAPAGPTCLSCRHWSCHAILDEADAQSGRLRSALGVLHSWARMVREQRELASAVDMVAVAWCTEDGQRRYTRLVDVEADPTIRTERNLLTRQLDWIAAQPWVDEFHADITALAAQLRRFAHDEHDRPLPGWCFRLVDGTECGGHLWPAEPLHSSGYETADGVRAVACDRNADHRWEGDDLPRLALIVRTQQQEVESTHKSGQPERPFDFGDRP